MTSTIAFILLIVVCVAGLLAYALASKAEVKEIGRLSFFAALLVTLFVIAHIAAPLFR